MWDYEYINTWELVGLPLDVRVLGRTRFPPAVNGGTPSLLEGGFCSTRISDPKSAMYKKGIHAEHVRDSLWQGADDREDILPYVREHELIIVTSDVKDFSRSPSDANAGVILLYDDTMPAYQVAAGLITMTDAYRDRAAFDRREELDTWVGSSMLVSPV